LAADNQRSSRHVYTQVVSAAFRPSAALLVLIAVFLSPMAVLGQRGGGDGPFRIEVGQDGGARGRAGGFRGRGERPSGTAVIRGIVTSDTGTPVRRALVRANVGGQPGARTTATDVDGRFELQDLPAGRWTLSASKPGFVTQRYGQRRPFETVQPIELTDGQKMDGANFSLLRGGVINGRLQDDLGDPAANVRVIVQRRQMVDGSRRLVGMGVNDETDDTGSFRLYGLAPGEYYVSATPRPGLIEQPSDRGAYAPIFYPGTFNVSEAQRVVVGAGEEVSIGFSLLPVRLSRITGAVVSQSAEVSGGMVQLSSATDVSEGPVFTQGGGIANDGTFTINNVPPGSYVLNARSGVGSRGGRGARPAGEIEIGTLPVVVGESDLTGVTIVLTRGASISGTVVTEGSAPITLSNLRVVGRASRAMMGQNMQGSGVSSTGGFQLSSLVGPLSLRVENLPQQWMVKSIMLGSTDVTDGTFDLRGSEQIANARIVLTDRLSEVNGTVKARNEAAKDSNVIVFAEDAALWTFPTRYVRTSRTDAQGRFTLRGLPPGANYLVAAVDSLEEGEWQDPEFLERLRQAASRVSFREGETKTVSLELLQR
jgi:hypothetical protein